MTSFLAGIAQQDGLININEPSSKYLGVGWTSLPIAKEQLITVRHNLTMTTGLDDAVSEHPIQKLLIINHLTFFQIQLKTF